MIEPWQILFARAVEIIDDAGKVYRTVSDVALLDRNTSFQPVTSTGASEAL